MSLRIPLSVAVVGALLAGGAAMGTTRASWRDQAPLEQTVPDAGRMGFSVGTPTPLADLEQSSSSSATATFTVTDTSRGEHLTQRITATVAGAPPGTTATVGTSCGTTQASVFVDRNPGGTATLCVKVVSSDTATPGTGAVTVALDGLQLPAGWSTPTQTVTLPVMVTQPTVATPTVPAIRCGTQVGTGGHSFEWDAVAGATSYSIYQAASRSGPFATPVAVGPGLSHTVSGLTKNETFFFRVTAVTGAAESDPSNMLRVRQNGESDNVSCGAP